MQLPIKLINDPLALVPPKMPWKGTSGSAGFDVHCTRAECWFDTLGYAHIKYYTGVAVEIPTGYYGMLACRSSVVKTDLMIGNGHGVIDSDYRGEISMEFLCRYANKLYYDCKTNLDTLRKYAIVYAEGDRIGQLLILPYAHDVQLVELDELSSTERGEGGYGSTGV